MGQIVKVKDVSKEGSTDVQITYDLVDKNNIDIIYGMHPAISYRNLATNIVHHKKVGLAAYAIRGKCTVKDPNVGVIVMKPISDPIFNVTACPWVLSGTFSL